MIEDTRKTVLIVDDEPSTIHLLVEVLKTEYRILAATDGAQALDLVERVKRKPDIILLDVIMPNGMNGYDVCKRLKSNPQTKNIPVIFITTADKPELEAHGLLIGAVDYIHKPFNIDIVQVRIKTHLELKSYRDDLERQVDERTREVLALNREIIDTQKEVIFTLGDVVETRSKETANHVQRVSEYIYILAKMKGIQEEEAKILKAGAPMHDVGKIGIPEAILNKPARLTPGEHDEIKKHAQIGYEILNKSDRPILKAAAIVSYQHHERWDGNGYPQGLKGEEIHLYGRIAAIADVFDALAAERCYKPAWIIDEIIKEFEVQRGKQFDPDLTDLFLQHFKEFVDILKKFPEKN